MQGSNKMEKALVAQRLAARACRVAAHELHVLRCEFASKWEDLARFPPRGQAMNSKLYRIYWMLNNGRARDAVASDYLMMDQGRDD